MIGKSCQSLRLFIYFPFLNTQKKSSMKLTLIFSFLGLLLVQQVDSLPRLLSSYTTDSDRTTTIKTACDGKSRTDLYESTQGVDRSAAENTVGAMFGNFDIDAVFQSFANGNLGTVAMTQVQTNLGSFIAGIGVFLIPIIVWLFLAPCLCCCCCCPNSCPSECCRQPKDVPYTDFQIKCPAFFVSSFAIVLIIVGLMIVAWDTNVKTAFEDIECSTAVMFDDIINGNVSFDGNSFFIGVETLGTELGKVNGNISNLETEMDTISSDGSTMASLYTDIDSALTEIQEIPDGSGGALTLTYDSPVIDSSPSSTISSTFPTVLGTASGSGLIYVWYTAMSTTKSALQLVSLAADAFESGISAFTSAISGVISAIDSLALMLTVTDQTINGSIQSISGSLASAVMSAIYAFVSLMIVFAVLALVASCLMLWCQKHKFRYMLYAGCSGLLIMGLFCLLLAILFAIVAPVSYLVCSFVEPAIESKAGFEEKIGPIINNDYLINLVGQCLPNESGDIVSTAVGTDVFGLLTDLDDVMEELDSFDATTVVSDLQLGYSGVTTTIGQYKRAEILDITSTSDISDLTDLSNASAYSCSASGFSSDSWVPSVSQQSDDIPCLISSGSNATNSTCTSTSDLESRASGCVGCMDTYLIFQGNTTASAVKTILDNRYSGCGSGFNTDLSNAWENYYYVKESTIGDVYTRSAAADSSISAIQTTISGTVAPLFTSTLSDLTGNFSTITDSKYGLLAGLNCKVIGEDIQLFVNTMCNNLILYSLFLEVGLGLVGYTILFLACCSVCLGVRHYRLQEEEGDAIGMIPENTGQMEDTKQNGVTAEGFFQKIQ